MWYCPRIIDENKLSDFLDILSKEQTICTHVLRYQQSKDANKKPLSLSTILESKIADIFN